MRFIVFSLSILLALFIAEVGICLPGPQIDYQEDWNTSNDLGEWESNTTVTNVIPSDHNGNPGGYLNSSGTAAGSFDIGALTKIQQVTGDFRGSTWSISVDVQFIAGNFDALWIRFRYKDSTENGWVFPLASTFPPGTWKTYFVAFNPDWTDGEARAHGWLTDRDIIPNANPSQPWNITMSDVYTTEVRVSGEGPVEVGIDNFHLQKAVSGVANPLICDRVVYNAAENSWTCFKD